jgi:hypothetical protein
MSSSDPSQPSPERGSASGIRCSCCSVCPCRPCPGPYLDQLPEGQGGGNRTLTAVPVHELMIREEKGREKR